MNGEFVQALASFDHVLTLRPTHVDAQLGRVRNLSFLNRADDAVTAATASRTTGGACRLDMQEALRLLANSSVYALAGSSAYARKDLDTAVQHFDAAVHIDPTNGTAASSAALVHVDRGAWLLAAEKYSTATNCFALAAKTARADLQRLEQSAIEPAVKAARLSTAQKPSSRPRSSAAGQLSARRRDMFMPGKWGWR